MIDMHIVMICFVVLVFIVCLIFVVLDDRPADYDQPLFDDWSCPPCNQKR